MNTKSRSRFFPYVLLVMLIAIASYFVYQSLNPAKKLSVIKPASAFDLEDLEGQSYDSDNMAGAVHLMEFIFTNCPDICPVTTYNMVEIQNQLKEIGIWGKQVKMMAITFDPIRDTPEVLNQYAIRMKMDRSGWALLRGDENQVQQVAKKYGVTIQNMGDGQFVHNVTSLILVDGKQQIRQIYEMGSDMDNERIIDDIKTLVDEL